MNNFWERRKKAFLLWRADPDTRQKNNTPEKFTATPFLCHPSYHLKTKNIFIPLIISTFTPQVITPSRVQIFQRRFRGCENAFLFIAIVKPTPYYQFLNHELSKDDPIAEENRKVLDPLTFPRPKAFNLYVLPSHRTDAAFALSN